MSTWQIFSDADNNFRWKISDQQLHIESKEDEPGEAPLLPSMPDLLLQGCLEIMENYEGRFQSPPMFRSGLGKSVAVKQSSLAKALSIIGDEGGAFIDIGQMFNGHKNGFNFSNSMFQTGSGKKVNISSTGLVRAKTLLGLEENYDLHPSSSIEHSKNQSTSFGWKNSSQLKTIEGDTNSHKDATTAPMPLFIFKTGSLGNDSNGKAIPDAINSATKCLPIKFNTASGRSISVSRDALQRAKSLLGDLELGTLFNEGDVNNAAFLFSKQGSGNHCNKEISTFSIPYHQEIVKTKHVSKSFTSPLCSDYSRMQSSVMSDHVSLRSNLIKKFDAEDFNKSCKMSNYILRQKKPPSCGPLSNVEMDNSLPNGDTSRISMRESSLSGPLVDISNKIGMSHADSKLTTGEKRGIGRSSISSFKRPRSSRFTIPSG